MKHLIGTTDLVFITLDTLRFDAAQQAWNEGGLRTLGPLLGQDGWEKRHSPGSFTYAAHHAFFAGFLPTPAAPGPHPRLFAAEFAGSASTVGSTFVFEEATLPEALAARGYRTVCIGGTGFFNRRNRLSCVLPDLFQESHWNPDLGVTCRRSPENQVELALRCVRQAGDRRVFLFINISAIHQPNWFYGGAGGNGGAGEAGGAEEPAVDSSKTDTLETHREALVAVDHALEPLFAFMKQRGPTFVIVCSDHGTAYGEDGHFGHRLGHEVVWTVPYADFML